MDHGESHLVLAANWPAAGQVCGHKQYFEYESNFACIIATRHTKIR